MSGARAGVDEAGRGPLIGPVVAAAVILPETSMIEGLTDSKALSTKRRERLYERLMAEATVSIASSSARRIDEINIRQATLDAMRRAVLALPLLPEEVLVDGRDIPPGLPCPAQAVIGGDRLIPAISAASIIAKVTRDRMMIVLDSHYPDYQFKKHKGYGVSFHLNLIKSGRFTAFHRKSFSPVKEIVAIKNNKNQQP